MEKDDLVYLFPTGSEMDELDYWRQRCQFAENYIKQSPCDPDITSEQIRAYKHWKDFIEENKEFHGNPVYKVTSSDSESISIEFSHNE